MQRVTDGRASMLGAATLLLAVVALAFPAFASAAPGCPSSVTMDDVHSGTSQFTCADLRRPERHRAHLLRRPWRRRAARVRVARRQRRRLVLPQRRRQGPRRLDRRRRRQRGRQHARRVLGRRRQRAAGLPEHQHRGGPRAAGLRVPRLLRPRWRRLHPARQPRLARHERRRVRRPHLPVGRELRGSRQLHVLRERRRRERQPRHRVGHGHQRRPVVQHLRQQPDAPHRQADHAARQLLRRRRRPGHGRPHDARARHAGRLLRLGLRRLHRDLHALRHLHRPGHVLLQRQRRRLELGELRLRPDHHRQPRPAVRRQRRGPRAGRHRRPGLVLLQRPGRSGPAPHLHPGRRLRARARHARARLGLPGRPTRPPPASPARTASASAPPTARCPTPTPR